jgi:polyhydroxyalkanoate synthesis regulator phasin
LLEGVLKEKRREIIKEWVKEGKISLEGAIKG